MVFDNVSVNIVRNGGNLGNAANASYNAATKTLTLSIDGSGARHRCVDRGNQRRRHVHRPRRDTSDEINTAGGTVLASSVGTGVANTYNTGGNANTLDVYIQTGQTTASDVAAAINASRDISG